MLHMHRLQHKTDEQKAQITTRLVKREQMKRDRLRELGIEYDFDGYAKTLPAKQLKDQKEEKKALDAAKKLEDQVKKDATAAPAKSKDAKKKGKAAKGAAAAPADAVPAASAEAKEPTRSSKRARKVRFFGIHCSCQERFMLIVCAISCSLPETRSAHWSMSDHPLPCSTADPLVVLPLLSLSCPPLLLSMLPVFHMSRTSCPRVSFSRSRNGKGFTNHITRRCAHDIALPIC